MGSVVGVAVEGLRTTRSPGLSFSGSTRPMTGKKYV